jgi:hypothetical protein
VGHLEAIVTLKWDAGDGRLVIADGVAVGVTVHGPRAGLRWRDDAFELYTAPASEAPTEGTDETVSLVVRHPFETPGVVWVPHLAPEAGNVMGDAVFRSPAFVISGDGIALALIPDLDDVSRAAGWRAWLDYDHPRQTVTLAAGAYEPTGHVFFTRRSAAITPHPVALRLHVVASSDAQDLENPYGMASRWIWNRWGRRGLLRAPAPPTSALLDYIVRWAFSANGWAESVWQPVALPGASFAAGAPVFIVDVTRHPSVPRDQRRWREPLSIWNQAWFSTQRCANGLLRYARQVGSGDLEDRAGMMTRIALAAPQREGLFPAVLIKDDGGGGEGWRWTNSDRRPPSASERACHIVDAAWTCRMLLEWHALTGDGEALAYVRRFAARVKTLQRPSGAFPGWVEPDGRIPPELAEGPESAVAAALLFELGENEPACRALSFLEGVVREGRWEDFETYYSCAPWGAPEMLGRRVPRNGVYKQNTLSIAWCAEAFLRAWRTTGNASYLRMARRCIDELSLYQAVWDPPFLPAPAHGGFGVMNGDCEWNDARQSLFALLYLELGRETGERELTERGVAALRASFSMLYCPENAALARAYEGRFPFFGPESYGFMMENQGHNPAEPIGTFTIYSWGNGSALATAAAVRDRFPEVAIDCGFATAPRGPGGKTARGTA